MPKRMEYKLIKHIGKASLGVSFLCIALALLFSTANTADFTQACYDLIKFYPDRNATTCTAEYSYKFPNEPQQALPATVGWCRANKHSQGWQKSNTQQWLVPLAGWVFPGIGLLLLCPIAEKGVHAGTVAWQQRQHQNSHPQQGSVLFPRLKEIWFSMKQWAVIIGDPPGAFCGTLSELATDLHLCTLADSDILGEERVQLIVKICILMGQVKFTNETVLPMEFLAGYRYSAPIARDALRSMLGGRIRFLSAIFLPALLYCGTAAAVIYEARMIRLGDNDAAHSLAYGTWYLWLFVLAVLSNCYGSHLNTDTIQNTLQNICQQAYTVTDNSWNSDMSIFPTLDAFKSRCSQVLHRLPPDGHHDEFRHSSLPCDTIKLHGRYVNNLKWRRWLENLHISGLSERQYTQYFPDAHAAALITRPRFYSYVGYQLLGWLPVAISCGCAATISYTTPKVGLSCRSLNHVAYAATTFALAIIRPWHQYLKYHPRPTRLHRRLRLTLSIIYPILVQLNVFLFVGGTAFQLAGLYRNCWCKAGLLPPMLRWDSIMQFANDTAEHRENARRIWVPIAAVAWGFVGGVCAVGLVAKQAIVVVLQRQRKGR